MSISHIICQYILVFKCCPLRVEEIFALKIKIVSFLKAIKTKISWGERGKMWYPRLQTFFVCMLSCVRLFATPWTVAQQAPLSVGFPRHEYQNGLPFSSPGDVPYPGIEPTSVASPTLAGGSLWLHCLESPQAFFTKTKKPSLPLPLQSTLLMKVHSRLRDKCPMSNEGVEMERTLKTRKWLSTELPVYGSPGVSRSC